MVAWCSLDARDGRCADARDCRMYLLFPSYVPFLAMPFRRTLKGSNLKGETFFQKISREPRKEFQGQSQLNRTHPYYSLSALALEFFPGLPSNFLKQSCPLLGYPPLGFLYLYSRPCEAAKLSSSSSSSSQPAASAAYHLSDEEIGGQ